MDRLTKGVVRFEREEYPSRKEFYERLIAKQFPRALFITCSDSRIDPNLITDSDPGDLFVIRNAGNIVPPYGEAVGGVSATIEYAVMALKIHNIIICGHTRCGAMDAALALDSLTNMPIVKMWLNHAEGARRIVEETCQHLQPEDRAKAMVEENVLAQLENLQTHPSVAVGLAKGEMDLYGWVFDIATGHVFGYDGDIGEFVPMSEEHIPKATPKRIRRV
ncbi:MAG: carbonic anhydrase [Bryobacter sp.]|nr:carbonic anhydrase [Bryobacter sp.]